MKMTVQAKLKSKYKDGVKIGVEVMHDFEEKNLIPEFYIAILNSMRDANKNEFYKAMNVFIENEIAEMGGEDDD